MLKSDPREAALAPDEPTRPQVVEDGVAAEVRDVLAHLRRRRGALLAVALAMAALGVAVAAVLPRLYTSTAQILVDPRGLRVFDNEVVPNGQISDTQSALVESQARVLRSDSVLSPVVAQERLAADPEFNGDPTNPVAAAVAAVKHLLAPEGNPDRTAVALSLLGEAAKVNRVPNSFVLELSVSARTAEKAARLAGAITDAYIAQAGASREASAKRVSEGLALRLDTLAADVKRAETAVDDFRRTNNIVDANGRPLTEQQLADLNNQLVAARVRSGELRSRVDQVAAIQRAGTLPDATNEAIASPAITALRNRYADLTQQRESLLTSLGPRHPSLQAVTAQLAGVRGLIAQEIGRIASSTRADYQRARATEQGLASVLTGATEEAGKVNTAAIRLRELEREAASRRALYESFLTRSRETREQGDLPSVNIAVISPAAEPLKRSGLPAALVVLLVAAFGTSAGALVLFGLDHLAGRIMTARQMSVLTGLPALAQVRRSRRTIEALHNALSDVVPGREPRVVLLVSTTRAVADLRLALGLARAAARDGQRVLLVDSDEDRLTAPFDKAVGAERRSWTPVRATPVPNMAVLAWSAPFTGAPTADGRGGAAALRHFAAEHDLILVHALAGEGGVRLRPLATAAGTVALLVDASVATTAAVEALRHELGSESVKVVGFAWVTPGGVVRVPEAVAASGEKTAGASAAPAQAPGRGTASRGAA